MKAFVLASLLALSILQGVWRMSCGCLCPPPAPCNHDHGASCDPVATADYYASGCLPDLGCAFCDVLGTFESFYVHTPCCGGPDCTGTYGSGSCAQLYVAYTVASCGPGSCVLEGAFMGCVCCVGVDADTSPCALCGDVS